MSQLVTHYTNDADQRSRRSYLIEGALVGQIAGLIMAVVVMAVFTVFLGTGPLYPVQVIGSIVFGDEALAGFHLPALIAGLLVHQLGPALLWGLVMGAAMQKLRPRTFPGVLGLGATIGLLSQVVDVNILLPSVMQALHGHDIWAEQVPAFWSWAAHLVFGLSLALFPKVSDYLARRNAT